MKNTKIKVKLSELKERDDNPRQITDEELENLKRSLKEFPEMLSVRGIVVDENLNILGGAQRVKALIALGYDELEVQQVSGWSEEDKERFIITDNVAKGSWDDEILKKWDESKLMDWGLDVSYNFDYDDDELMGRTNNNTEEKEKPYVFRAELTKEQYDEVMDIVDKLNIPARNEGLTNRLGYALIELAEKYNSHNG